LGAAHDEGRSPRTSNEIAARSEGAEGVLQLGAVPDEGHFPRTSNEMAARSEGTAGLLLTCPAAAAVRFPTARPRRYPADAPTTRPHSTTTLRDPRGAATYAVAASSRVPRPTRPRSPLTSDLRRGSTIHTQTQTQKPSLDIISFHDILFNQQKSYFVAAAPRSTKCPCFRALAPYHAYANA